MSEELRNALNEAGVDTKECIERCCDNENLFIRLLNVYFRGDTEIGKLTDAVAAHDYLMLLNTAHGMKGATGSIGLLGLHAILSTIVEDLRNENYTNIDTLVAEYLNCHNKLKRIVDTYNSDTI